jgi:hypothetical protein
VRCSIVSEATFVYCEKLDKKNSCVNEALLFGEKNTFEAKARLDKYYSDSAPRKSTVAK